MKSNTFVILQARGLSSNSISRGYKRSLRSKERKQCGCCSHHYVTSHAFGRVVLGPVLREEIKHVEAKATELQVTPAPPGAAPQGQPGKQASCLPEPRPTESPWDFTNNPAADVPLRVM